MGKSVGFLAGLHTPRLDKRRKILRVVFSPEAMAKSWKNYVRPGLRNQEILDLFDYNDFHWNQFAVFQHLSQAIIDGRYKPGRSMAARLEKKFGVCRTIVTPSPEDAVTLQCIVEALIPQIIKKQPSKNAFFSRSHSAPKVEFNFGRDYIWFKRWPTFFKKRISISSNHDWVVTTDISTFFDNINYSHLRNILSTLDGTEEVILDILFQIIDQISWRPDYLPSVGVGLPQVQFDAPRLLAHAYLFEIDEYINEKTNGSFVRWVDDITFAVDSEVEGKTILRDIDSLLQLRGIRLNSGKTKILSKKDARKYFHGKENEFLDTIKERIDFAQKSGKSTSTLSERLRKKFDIFISTEKYGHSEKICKRYIGLFSYLKDDYAVTFCLKALINDPELRDTIYRYFTELGHDKQKEKHLLEYITSAHALDDASIFQVAKILTDWHIAPKTSSFRNIRNLGLIICGNDYTSKSQYYFVAGIWILSKYGNIGDLKRILEETEGIWSNSEFLSRQVAAMASRFRSSQQFRWISMKIERHGFKSAMSVINSLTDLHSYENFIPSNIKFYILNGKNKGRYSIQRFLITHRVLTSKLLNDDYRSGLAQELLQYVSDPYYTSILKKI